MAFETVNYLKFLISGDSAQFQAEVEKAKRTATGFIDGISESMGGLKTLIGGLFASISVTAFVGKLVSVQREFDVLNSSMVTVTGSSAAAAREMQWIKAFAKDTPYGLTQATEAFVKMRALGLEPTQAKLTSFGNTASAMGKDLMQMIEAVADASTGEFERLKEFGIKASKQGESVAFTFQGVTTVVKNSAKDITGYLENIGNVAFGGAMEQRAKTLDGAIASLGDSWDELFRKINESTGFSEKAAAGVRLVTDAIDGLGDSIQKHQGVVMGLVGGLGGAAAAAGILAVGGAIGMVKGAFLALTAAMVANPITLALLGVGAVAGVGLMMADANSKSIEGIRRSVSGLRDEIKGLESEKALVTNGERYLEILRNIEDKKKKILELETSPVAKSTVGGGRGFVNPETVAEISTKRAEEQAKAEQDLANIRRTLYGVNKDYLPQLQRLNELRQAGKIKESEYIELVTKLAKENYKESDSSKGRAASIKAVENSYKSFMATINERIEASKTELKQGQNLTENQKLRIKYEQELATKGRQYNAQQRANIEAGLLLHETAEKQAAAAKQLAKAWDDDAKAYEALAKQQDAQIASINTAVAKMRLEEEGHALAAEAGISHAEAVERLTIARLEDALAQMRQGAGTQEEIDRVQREIAARKELLGVLEQKAVRESNKKAADEAAKDWEKTAQTISRTLSDYIMSGGKDAAQYLKRLFSTLVLEPTVQAMAGSVLGTGQGATGGVAGLLGNINSASSLWSAFSGGTSGVLASGVVSLGKLMGSSFLGELGAGIAAGGQLGIGGAASLMGSASGTTGLGMALGAAAPWIAGGLALASAWSSLFGRKHEQKNLQGVFGGETGFEGNWHDYYKGGLFRSSKTVNTPLDEATRSGLADQFNVLRSTTKAMADVLGLGTEAIGAFTASVNIKLKDLSAEDAQKKIQEEFDAIAEALAGLALGTEVYSRAGETAVGTLTRLSGSLASVNSVFEQIGATLYASSLAGAEMSSSLLDLFGGADQFGTATGTYFQNFFSVDERRAALERQLNDALARVNLQLPDIDASNAREQYRALADAQDLTTESGRQAWTVLMQLSGGFASITAEMGAASVGIQGMLSSFTVDASSIGQIIHDAATGASSVIEAQTQASNAFIEGFYNNALGGLTSSLGDLIQNAVVQPMMQTLLGGAASAGSVMAAGGATGGTAVSIGGQLAADAMASVLQQARAQIGAMTQILNDKTVQAGIRDIADLIGDVSGSAHEANQKFRAYNYGEQPIPTWTPSAYSTPSVTYESGIDEAARAAQSEADRISNLYAQQYELLAQIAELQGDAAAAAQIRYAAETEGMSDAERAAYDYIKGLRDQVTAAQAAAAEAERVKGIYAQQADLQAQLAEAQGDTARAARIRYDAETQGMSAAERAAYDYIQGLRDQVTAAQAAAGAVQSLTDQQWALENQLLTLQGRTQDVADRTREYELQRLLAGVTDARQREQIAAAYDYNRALQGQIDALEAAQRAAQEAADAQRRAAEQARRAWQSIADSIVDEINRIRGVVVADSMMGLDYYQAQFAIATGQARAGDQDAAQRLTGLSDAMLRAAEQSATTMVDLQRYRNQTAGSLEETLRQLGRFGVDMNFSQIGLDAGYSAPQAPVYQGQEGIFSGFSEIGNVVAELRALREENRELREENRAQAGEIARLNLRVARVLERWDIDGMPEQREYAND